MRQKQSGNLQIGAFLSFQLWMCILMEDLKMSVFNNHMQDGNNERGRCLGKGKVKHWYAEVDNFYSR